MDWKLIGEGIALFTLGVAYGAVIEAYVNGVRYFNRRKDRL